MKLKITVKQAINKGQMLTVLVPLLLAIAFIFITATNIEFSKNRLLTLLIGGLIIAFVSRSFAITYWKIWAYENVNNVHALKARAIQDKIIWPDNSFLQKTEIKTKSQKAKLKELEKRFLKDNPIYDDSEIPRVTHIHLSKLKMYINLFLGFVMIGCGVYLYLYYQEKGRKIVYIIPVIGLFMIFDSIRKLRNKTPLLTIDDKGIYIHKTKKFFTWDNINSTEFYTISDNDYIKIHHSDGTEQVKTDRMNPPFSEFAHILDIYSLRYEKNKTIDDRMKMRELT